MTMRSAVGVAFTAAALSATPAMAQVEWKFFSPWPSNFEIANWDRGYTADVNAAAAGKLKLVHYTGGELPYRGNDVLKAVATNRVQMVATVAGFVDGEAPELNVFSLPFICTTYDGFLRAIRDAAPVMDEYLERKFQVRALYHWTFPPQQVFTVKPLETLSGMKGMKIRLWNNLHSDMVKLYGAVPATIDPTELTPALQRGVVDGTITSATTIVDTKLYDVTRGGLMLDFMLGHSFTLVNAREYDRLPREAQDALRSAAVKWTAETDKRSRAYDEGARATLAQHGMTLKSASPAEIAAAQTELRGSWDAWATKHGATGKTLVEKTFHACGRTS